MVEEVEEVVNDASVVGVLDVIVQGKKSCPSHSSKVMTLHATQPSQFEGNTAHPLSKALLPPFAHNVFETVPQDEDTSEATTLAHHSIAAKHKPKSSVEVDKVIEDTLCGNLAEMKVMSGESQHSGHTSPPGIPGVGRTHNAARKSPKPWSPRHIPESNSQQPIAVRCTKEQETPSHRQTQLPMNEKGAVVVATAVKKPVSPGTIRAMFAKLPPYRPMSSATIVTHPAIETSTSKPNHMPNSNSKNKNGLNPSNAFAPQPQTSGGYGYQSAVVVTKLKSDVVVDVSKETTSLSERGDLKCKMSEPSSRPDPNDQSLRYVIAKELKSGFATIHAQQQRQLPSRTSWNQHPALSRALPTQKWPPKPISSQESKKVVQSVHGLLSSMEQPQTLDDHGSPLVLPSLTCTLMPHQVAGVKWMIRMENSGKHGGILADDMGLGKTVQTIALVLNANQDLHEKSTRRGTLIVAPLSLLKQWEQEILAKVDKQTPLKVLVYHGNSRISNLGSYDVVITTYSLVGLENRNSMKNQSSATDQIDENGSPAEGDLRPLFRKKWYRVVLDEAHSIKNRETKAAQGCAALDSCHRWCLTGTPIQNSAEELFSLLHFLRMKPYWDNYNLFKSEISQHLAPKSTSSTLKRNEALQLLQLCLHGTMLRRTKQVAAASNPLLNLPPKTVILKRVPFTSKYQERQFYDQLEERLYTKFKKLQQSGQAEKSFAQLLLLLLRLRQACNHTLMLNPAELKKFLQRSDDVPNDQVAELIRDDVSAMEKAPVCEDEISELLGGLVIQDKKKLPECQICFDKLIGDAAAQQFCSKCEEMKSLSKGISSTKLDTMLDIIRDVSNDDAGAKIIIFSQFTTMLDLVEVTLRSQKIRFCKYDGRMRKEAREESTQLFITDIQVKVMLISMKCGSVGLNLIAANHVIMLDMWWNPAIEEQCYDRVHRIGQKKPVTIYRITIANTVEDRILNLQKRKRELSTGALGDHRKQTVNAKDIESLFKKCSSNSDASDTVDSKSS